MPPEITEKQRTAIGERVRSERKALKLTQSVLADMVGCSQPAIVNMEKGGSFQQRLLRDVASALGVGEGWLLSGRGSKTPTEKAVVSLAPALSNLREVPVVSWATAGAAKDYTDLANFLDEKVATENKDPNAFAVIVDGDSMEPKISIGDRVVVSPNSEPQSGNIVVARTRKDHGVYLKKFLRHGPQGNKVRLVSLNPEYPPLEFDLSDFSFIYPVVGLFRKM